MCVHTLYTHLRNLIQNNANQRKCELKTLIIVCKEKCIKLPQNRLPTNNKFTKKLF